MFFNQRFLRRVFGEGDDVLMTGNVSEEYGLHLMPEEFEVLGSEDYEPIHASGLVPMYTAPSGFGHQVEEEFRRFGLKCFDCAATEVETLRDAARYHEKPLEEILEALKKLKIPNPES